MRLKLTAAGLAVLAVTLAGCHNRINLIYYPGDGKVSLHPNPGDVIMWKDNDGNVLPNVAFDLGSPCVESDAEVASKGICTIKEPSATGFHQGTYSCDKCVDPEIMVGSDSGIALNGLKPKLALAPEVQMACYQGTTVRIGPKKVNFTKAEVSAGTATIQFVKGGNPEIGDDWTTNDLSSICSNGPIFKKGNDTCKVISTATTTNFTVSAASCNNTSATGTIAVQ